MGGPISIDHHGSSFNVANMSAPLTDHLFNMVVPAFTSSPLTRLSSLFGWDLWGKVFLGGVLGGGGGIGGRAADAAVAAGVAI